MSDNKSIPLGQQIRSLRQARRWSLAELARRAGTSAPAIHRYENGWDRFELDTLRRIGAALDARVEVRLVPAAPAGTSPQRSWSPPAIVKLLAPLFWDRRLQESDLDEHAGWVLERVLTTGNRAQVAAARSFFGDAAVLRATGRRGVDARTRRFWHLILGENELAPESPGP